MSSPNTVVYFMREVKPHAPHEELIKIGISTNAEYRRLQLQCVTKTPLRLVAAIPGTRKDEQGIHRLFSSMRVRGEWFKPCPEIQAVIDTGRFPDRACFPPPPPRKLPPKILERLTINIVTDDEVRVLRAFKALAFRQGKKIRTFMLETMREKLSPPREMKK